MGKHTQNCTLIGKGVYGTIGVDQRSRLADGAHFHTMIVTSTLGSARVFAHFGLRPSPWR